MKTPPVLHTHMQYASLLLHRETLAHPGDIFDSPRSLFQFTLDHNTKHTKSALVIPQQSRY